MSLILLIVGAVLWYMGRIRLGGFETQGRHVRVAGVILMLPASLSFIIGIVIGILSGGRIDSIINMLGLLSMIELVLNVVAAIVAYILIVDPDGAPQLPGILGDIQQERRQNIGAMGEAKMRRIEPTVRRQTFGSILSVQQAAEYLGVTEANIIDLIEDGKLAAARINYHYQIARSALDDFKAQEQTLV